MAGYLWISDGEVEGEGEYAEGSDVVCFFFFCFFLLKGGLGSGLAPDTSVCARERENFWIRFLPGKLSSKLSFIIHICIY